MCFSVINDASQVRRDGANQIWAISQVLLCRFKKVSYTVEAVTPADSSSITGQQHVQQLQSVESELLRTREEMAVFEKTYREVSMAFTMILSSKMTRRIEDASHCARLL